MYPTIDISYLARGAEFLPSTVCCVSKSWTEISETSEVLRINTSHLPFQLLRSLKYFH